MPSSTPASVRMYMHATHPTVSPKPPRSLHVHSHLCTPIPFAELYDTNSQVQLVSASPLVYFRNVPATGLYLTSTVFADDPTRSMVSSATVMDDFFGSVMNQSPFMDVELKSGSEVVLVGGLWVGGCASGWLVGGRLCW